MRLDAARTRRAGNKIVTVVPARTLRIAVRPLLLQTLKKNKWAIPVGIEFEDNVPAGSTWDAEIAACVQYGKAALLGSSGAS